MAEIHVGAIDPVAAFSQQIGDVIALTEAFTKNENLRPIDYLRACHAARENINAIIMVTFSSIMSSTGDRVSNEQMAEHMAEMEAAVLALSQDERMENLHKRLRKIAKNFTIDTETHSIDDDSNPDIPEGG